MNSEIHYVGRRGLPSLNKNLFLHPPMDYRAVPFWSWNGKLDVEETRWQVREMSQKGMGGSFIHARSGLQTEYLGKDWFENFAAAIDEGRKSGFTCWIYDEDRWPSGSAGGTTAAVNSDYRSRVLIMQRGNEPVVRNDTHMNDPVCESFVDLECLGRFRLTESSENQPQFQPACEGQTGPEIVSFYSATLPPCGWQNDGYYPDLLHDGVTREFVRNTYENYERRFRSSFGKEIPGIFTDEPVTYGPVPWSVTLPDEFRKRRGYDLLSKLPLLFFDTDQSAGVRHDYWRSVYELFTERYMARLGKWCGERNVLLTGHLMGECNLWDQISYGGGAMAHYVHMQIPGIDILSDQVNEVATCKQASSICNQFDKSIMLSECYGGGGYEFSFEDQKRVGDWQMVLGVSLICPHLTPYTLKGCAKRDYPGNFFYQSPWWRHYSHIADYQARLCYLLRKGRPVRDILVIHPLTGAWCGFDPQAGPENGYALAEQNRVFHDTLNHLLSLHRDFDLGDELVMEHHARLDGSEMAIGEARYKLIIVPPTCNLESSTVSLLEKYVAGGGRVIWLEPVPTLIDGRPSSQTRITSLVDDPRVARSVPTRSELEGLLDVLLPRDISIIHADTHKEAHRVFYQHRIVDDQHMVFLVNTDCEVDISLKIRLPLTGACELWNCENGKTSSLASLETDFGSEFEVVLPPVGSAVLMIDPDSPAISPKKQPSLRTLERVLNPHGRWAFQRLAPNSLVLDRCCYRVKNEEFSDEMFMVDAQEKWRKRFGLFPVRMMNTDTQPWKKLRNHENLKPITPITLRYNLHVEQIPQTQVYLVLEDRADFEIYCNGRRVENPSEGWFMDKSFEKVPIGSFLEEGENTIEIRTGLTEMRIIEDVYITGDFAVNPKTFTIMREPEYLACGNWCAQGYPFYTDAMLYKAQIDVSDNFEGKVFVELEDFSGTVVCIWVNGRKAVVLGWQPYRADVTEFVQPGSNDLGIEVVGSQRNLMGPRHSADSSPCIVTPGDINDTSATRYHITSAGLMGGVRIVYSQRDGDHSQTWTLTKKGKRNDPKVI